VTSAGVLIIVSTDALRLDYIEGPFYWPENPLSVVVGFLAAGIIGFLGHKFGALTMSGAVAACLVGGTVFGFGGPGAALLLILFFITSTALSFWKRGDARKMEASAQFEKGRKRDAGQVLANGGVAALAALLAAFIPGMGFSGFMLGAFCGAIATAAADTWATEIGVLSEHRPKLITTLREVEPGSSGGITTLGIAASVLGALAIGWAALLLELSPNIAATFRVQGMANIRQLYETAEFQAAAVLGATLIGGIAGSLADSLMGATLQAQYRCPQCDKPTERRVHGCGTATRLVRGVAWVNNDTVNMLATGVGAVAGGIMWTLLYI
jgi:uncharacterized protein (TIGR00297 family)